jgi:ATP-dependent Zn protease
MFAINTLTKTIMLLLCLVILVCANNVSHATEEVESPTYFTYSEFIDNVKSEKIISVNFEEYVGEITGKYKSSDNNIKKFTTFSPDINEDPLLNELLKSKNVKRSVVPCKEETPSVEEGPSSAEMWLMVLIIYGLPTIGIFLIYQIYKRQKNIEKSISKIEELINKKETQWQSE